MKTTATLLFIIVCVSAFAAGVPSPSTPHIFVDDDGTLVSTTNPLPVVTVPASTASGSPSIPPDTASQTMLAVTATTATINAFAARQNITIHSGLYATETVWISVGTTTAVVGRGIPIYAGGYASIDLADSVPMGRVSSTPSSINVTQTGY